MRMEWHPRPTVHRAPRMSEADVRALQRQLHEAIVACALAKTPQESARAEAERELINYRLLGRP